MYKIKYFFLGVFVVAIGLSVLAVNIPLPHTFTAGTQIKAGEVNANFNTLKTAIESMQTSGLSLPAELEGTLTAEDKALLSISSKDIGFAIVGKTAQGQAGVFGSSGRATGSGVEGNASAANAAGVLGLNPLGPGVWGRSETSIGVYGQVTAAKAGIDSVAVKAVNAGEFGYGVQGEHKGKGFGVFGKSAATGVGGESPGGFGVRGVSTSGTGVWGISTTGSGVYGESAQGAVGNAGVRGVNTAATGSGVEGRADGTLAAGVFGINPSGPGVWGRSTGGGTGVFAESDSGYAFQGKTRHIGLSVESAQNTAAIVTTKGTGVSAFIVNQWGSGNIMIGRDASNAEVFRVSNDGSVFSKTNSYTSDRNAKTNFKSVDAGEVLLQVARLPISRWNYKNDSSQIAHIGPMAQDFHAAFGLNGSDDKHINAVDAQGIALAAIQGLYQMNQKLEAKNKTLEAKLDLLETQLSSLSGIEERLAVLEKQ